MNITEWKSKNNISKKYTHFDKRVSLSTVWDYITNSEKVSKHAFYPFIHYIKYFDKYNKKSGTKHKERELCYSAHIDRCIYQYYSFLLNQLYNNRIKQDGLNNVAIAYRDNQGKSNINFAKEAIDYIRKMNDCYIIVGDFTKFFDKLDHKYLKARLVDLLGRKLPDDYYAVYKNITRFSTWDLVKLLEINNLKDTLADRRTLNSKERIITPEEFKKYKSECIHINSNDYGIPQGSAISAVLSNIYMLEFDKKLNDYVQSHSGLYMRYSDDFIVILPNMGSEHFKSQLKDIRLNIDKIPNLELQPEKTQIFKFYNTELLSCNKEYIENTENGINLLNYLGFTFDGHVVTIRDKTISKYYYRMYRKLKTIVDNEGYTSYGNKISCENLYLKYSLGDCETRII